MADLAQRLPANVAGPLFVDRTCIDCDTCRQLAPATFSDAAGKSSVRVQPQTPADLDAALRALVACPVGAIGDTAHRPLHEAIAAFPMPIDERVALLGFNARESYGANSYFFHTSQENWLIDAPRWNAALAHALEARGGVDTIFLTHSDDVADAARYAAHFGARRIIHERERSAQPDAEIIISGDDPIAFGECTVIPTPGHTRGHCVLHAGDYLFSGDHLAWDPVRRRLDGHRDVCWFDWPTQLRSIERLAAISFRRLLPGHGERVRLEPEQMREAIVDLVARN
jgi:glyoxylase-like metal-dependent hydrolase (beta-lactamase superfamily II)/ferredoxin